MIRMFVVYNSPPSNPGRVVVREWHSVPAVGVRDVGHRVVDSIEEARDSIPGTLTLIPRHPTDHPSIVETWK